MYSKEAQNVEWTELRKSEIAHWVTLYQVGHYKVYYPYRRFKTTQGWQTEISQPSTTFTIKNLVCELSYANASNFIEKLANIYRKDSNSSQ